MLPYMTITPITPGCVQCTRCAGFVDSLFYPVYTDKNGLIVCKGCVDWFTCADCGDECNNADKRENPCGADICEDCYDNNYSTCEDCGGLFNNEDLTTRGHRTLCSDCACQAGDWEPAGFTKKSDSYDRVGSSRCFGVEIETSSCDDYTYLYNDDAWGAKNDCSISGKEFVSDILSGNDGLAEVARLCNFADRNGWDVDSRCGLHVHFDVSKESDENLKRIAGAYLATYSVWKEFVDSRRLNNIYCEASNSTFNEIEGWGAFSDFARCQPRYEWVNFAAYSKHKTFEIRLHHGSLDAQEICNWVRAHTVFADWAAKHSLADIKRTFGRLDATGKFHKLCAIWTAAGCADLVDYYSSAGGFNKPVHTVYADKIDEVRALGALRGIR